MNDENDPEELKLALSDPSLTRPVLSLSNRILYTCLDFVLPVFKLIFRVKERWFGRPKSIQPWTIKEYEREGKKKLHSLGAMYYNFSQDEGLHMRRCREAYEAIRLVPRILRNVSEVDVSCRLFGSKENTLDIPVVVAPTALHSIACQNGEIATAQSTKSTGVGYCYNFFLSSSPLPRLLESTKSINGPKMWFHVYLFKQKEQVLRAIKLAEVSGAFSAVILTCDHPHNRVALRTMEPFQKLWYWLNMRLGDPLFPNRGLVNAKVVSFGESIITELQEADVPEEVGTIDPSLDWSVVKWIKNNTKLPVVVKGVLSVKDAVLACENGADGIVVSNHGSRQCSFAPTAIEVLPSIAKALNGRKCDIWIDSGVRSGADVLRAICLGATGVLIGRPALYALAYDGREGLERMLKNLKIDIQSDMQSLGYTSLSDLGEHVVYANS
eukprot:CAMPEP_0184064634 /NCGR_PEP_ID=MMETSP0957-20130417/2117_1 /TAXON_ID=627963 /ORGANISM="Aplanochytrium sp, Strain PBS07" /LENGTH=439 /DNA_ID=CAMNT_0026362087 /DNA_START=84 /DNA_END=1403 /DNA_ORIENTATION=+